MLLAALSLLPLCLAHACGGQTSSDDDRDGRGGRSIRADAGKPDAAAAGTGGSDTIDPDDDAGPDAVGGAGTDWLDGGSDAEPNVYDDPGCPDAEAPPGVVECDAFNEPSGCPVGEGCFPYVDHPFGEGCGQQSFGAVCLPAGSGVQGSQCGDGTTGCAAGFVCVVGAQTGKRCTKICDLNAPNTCDDGLICGETDVEGVGVCS